MAVGAPQLLLLIRELFCPPAPQVCCIQPGPLEGLGRHRTRPPQPKLYGLLGTGALEAGFQEEEVQVSCCILETGTGCRGRGTGPCSHRVAAGLYEVEEEPSSSCPCTRFTPTLLGFQALAFGPLYFL